MKSHFCLLVALVLGLNQSMFAQIQSERETLKGIDRFELSVEMERSGSLDDSVLDVGTLQSALWDRLQEEGLPVLPLAGRRNAALPYLNVHINILDAGNGLIPFTIDMGFYETLRQTRPPNASLTARTWKTGLLGLTYQNQLQIIPDNAVEILGDFIEDFRAVNSRD